MNNQDKPKKYAFWIEVMDGAGGESEVRWAGLTLRQVQMMHKATDEKLRSMNVKTYGWEEMK